MWHLLEYMPQLEIWKGDFADFKDAEDAYNSLMAMVCMISAGLASGLTIGLLSMDITKLEIKALTGDAAEKVAASVILPVLKRRHQLMVTLLLYNSLATETLPIFLGAVVPNYLAVLLSVAMILVFGEILPSACFSGRRSLLLSARLIYLVYFLMIVLYPVAYPISRLLDYLFGEGEIQTTISRSEMEALLILQNPSVNTNLSESCSDKNQSDQYALIKTHHEAQDVESQPAAPALASEEPLYQPEEQISSLEVKMLNGVLTLSKRSVRQAMRNIDKVFMLSSSIRLNQESLANILNSGFSRIPVYRRRDKQWILGYLLVKELIFMHGMEEPTLENFALREPKFVTPSLGLLDMLSIFQESSCHLALVTNNPSGAISCLRTGQRPVGNAIIRGIITLEDVLETLIQAQIQDETDEYRRPSIYPQGFHSTSLVTRIVKTEGRHNAVNYRRKSDSNLLPTILSSIQRRDTEGSKYPMIRHDEEATRLIGSPSRGGKKDGDLVRVHIELPPAAPSSVLQRFSPTTSRGESEMKSLNTEAVNETTGVLSFIQQMQSYNSMEDVSKYIAVVKQRAAMNNTNTSILPGSYSTKELDSYDWM